MNMTQQVFLLALISAHGWKDQDPTREEKYWVTREIGGGFKGGMINPTGIRRLSAKFTDFNDMVAKHGDDAILKLAYNPRISETANIALFNQLVSSMNEAAA